MFKNLLFVISILFFINMLNIFKICDKHPKEDENEILWSSKRKLNWEDFKAIPDTTNTNVIALTSSEIQITENYVLNDIPKYILQCHFIKSKSWTKVSDTVTLAHEQTHFDISELFTRKIRKAFDSLNVKKIKDFEIYDKIYDLYGEKCDKYDDKYDDEVFFDDKKQQQWIKKVNVELLRLKKYEYVIEN